MEGRGEEEKGERRELRRCIGKTKDRGKKRKKNEREEGMRSEGREEDGMGEGEICSEEEGRRKERTGQ